MGCLGKIKERLDGRINTIDTTYEITTNLKGDTLDIKTIVRGKANGPFRSYYDNGKLWHSSYYIDGKLQGEAFIYTENGDVAEKETWKNSSLWESIVYWQAVPYSNRQKFYFLSNTGIYKVKNGRYIYDFEDTPPGGFVIEKYENEMVESYVYKNGELVLYPRPDR